MASILVAALLTGGFVAVTKGWLTGGDTDAGNGQDTAGGSQDLAGDAPTDDPQNADDTANEADTSDSNDNGASGGTDQETATNGLQSDLVAASDRGGDLDLYRHHPDGTVTLLLDRPSDDYAPSLSPDGTQVAFESTESGTRAVYIAPTDGSATPRRISPEGVEATAPAWSPLGRHVAWAAKVDGSWDIVVHDLDTDTGVLIATNPADDLNPSWSPDGASLAFRSDRTGNGDIYHYTIATRSLRRLTDHAGLEDNPAISGTGVVAFERRDGSDFEVFAVDLEGDGLPRRQTTRVGFDGSPTFSGEHLVYVSIDGSTSTIVITDGEQQFSLHQSDGLTRDVRIDGGS